MVEMAVARALAELVAARQRRTRVSGGCSEGTVCGPRTRTGVGSAETGLARAVAKVAAGRAAVLGSAMAGR